VLIQDDDLELPSEALQKLLDAWRADPHVLHGVFGRGPRPDGSYAEAFRGTGEVPVALTRALMTHRVYAAAFLEEVGQFDAVQFDSQPYGNGEDIIFSYVVRRRSGRLNRVQDLPVVELPAPDAIHDRDRPEHIAHRDRVLRACEAWLRASTLSTRSNSITTRHAADGIGGQGHGFSSLDFTLPTTQGR
jgi:hypothetical protein